MLSKKRILVVDDDESLRWVTQAQLQQSGYDVDAAADATSALEQIRNLPPDLVITDLKMPGMSGLDLLKEIRANYPDIIVIMVTAFGTVENAVEAMKAGAYDYITKPVNMDELRLIVNRGLEHIDLREEVRILREQPRQEVRVRKHFGPVEEAALRARHGCHGLRRRRRRFSFGAKQERARSCLPRRSTSIAVVRIGPSSRSTAGRFRRICWSPSCSATSKDRSLARSPTRREKSSWPTAAPCFWTRLESLPLELQVKLLRLIQQGEIEKLGFAGVSKVDVRIIAATHRNLQAMVEDETFREDLYYRLAVIPLELPPLRERADDIPELVQHFFLKAKEKQGRANLVLPTSMLPYFSVYTWPGNVRELENIIERIVVLSRGDEITLNDLPDFLRRERPAVEELHLDLPPHGISLEAIEKDLIVRALEKFNWNQTHAAQYLDLSRKTLIYRMEKFGLKKDRADAADAPQS